MRLLLSLVCIGALLVLAHHAASVVSPLLLGATLAIAFQPMSRALSRHGLPPIVAALLTTLVLLALVTAAGALIYVAATELAAKLPEYRERIEQVRDDLAGWLAGRGLGGAAASVRHYDPDDSIRWFLESSLFRAGAFLAGLFFVLVITAFIQLEASVYRRKLVDALGSARPVSWLEGGLREVQRYLVVKLLVSLVTGVLLGIWCWALGVDSAILWGVLAFVLNFVPFVGSLMAAIPPILLALVEGGLPNSLAVAAGYLAVNLVIGTIVEPRVLGRALRLSPLVILVSMLVWALVLGPVGAILSVPLTMVARIVFERDPDLRRVALLMSDGSELLRQPSPEPAPAVPPSSVANPTPSPG
jgi:AI-2 transport protein TqsA